MIFQLRRWLSKENIWHKVPTQKEKKGYEFEYYRPGQIVYHYTNLVIGTNLQLQTMPNKNSSKSRYLFPYSEHERLKDTIAIRGDPDGLVKWPQVGS